MAKRVSRSGRRGAAVVTDKELSEYNKYIKKRSDDLQRARDRLWVAFLGNPVSSRAAKSSKSNGRHGTTKR
jgi:hypothetical protein